MHFPLAEREIRRASNSEAEANDVIERMYKNYRGKWGAGKINCPKTVQLSDLFYWAKSNEGIAFWKSYGWEDDA